MVQNAHQQLQIAVQRRDLKNARALAGKYQSYNVILQIFIEEVAESSLVEKIFLQTIGIDELIPRFCQSPKIVRPAQIRAVFDQPFSEFVAKFRHNNNIWKRIMLIDTEPEIKKSFTKYLEKRDILCLYFAFQIAKTPNGAKFIFDQMTSDDSRLFEHWFEYDFHSSEQAWACWIIPLIYTLGFTPSTLLKSDFFCGGE